MLSESDKEILSLTKRKSLHSKETFVLIEPLETRILRTNFFSVILSLSNRSMLVTEGEVSIGTSTAVRVRLSFLGDLMLQHNDVHQSMKNFNLVARYCLSHFKSGNRNPEFLRLVAKMGVDSYYYVEDILRYLQSKKFIVWEPVKGGVEVGDFGNLKITPAGINALLVFD